MFNFPVNHSQYFRSHTLVGTVRVASFKAIGDVVANRGLNISTYGKFGPVNYSHDLVEGMCMYVSKHASYIL